jgi:hypothetical protein
MEAILRASVSLDGKLLTALGKPSRRGIPFDRVLNAGELILTIHPLIAGGNSTATLSGLPGEFLTQDLEWELVSTTKGTAGLITARYRRK